MHYTGSPMGSQPEANRSGVQDEGLYENVSIGSLPAKTAPSPGPAVPPVRPEPSSPPCRRTAVCLALLCAVLLAAIIALCVYYYTGSRAGMKGELDELRSKDSTLAYKVGHIERLKEQIARLTQTLTKLNETYSGLDFYCPVTGQTTWEGVCVCCPEGWKQFKSKCYYFSTDLLNWTDSRAACRKQGADLLTIRTQEEQEFIWNRLNKRNYWIGLTDAAAEGIWLWVDGTHPNPSFWRKDQPDDYHNEDCATIDSDPPAAPHESWNDLTCTKKQLWICETSLFAGSA